MVKVAAVFGLSGVGKSWLVCRYARTNRVLHAQASRLLREAKAATSRAVVTSEDLRTGKVLDNQQLLIGAFAPFHLQGASPVIFDGHCLVDSGDRLIEIPVSVIGALSVSGIVFVRSDAAAIAERRRNDLTRVRPLRLPEEISLHQERAVHLCEEYSCHLKLGLYIVDAGDEPGFALAMASIFDG